MGLTKFTRFRNETSNTVEVINQEDLSSPEMVRRNRVTIAPGAEITVSEPEGMRVPWAWAPEHYNNEHKHIDVIIAGRTVVTMWQQDNDIRYTLGTTGYLPIGAAQNLHSGIDGQKTLVIRADETIQAYDSQQPIPTAPPTPPPATHCNLTPVILALSGAGTAVIAALAFIGAAVAANASFWTAFGSVGFMIGAGISSTAAVAGLQAALVAMRDYYQCMLRLRGLTADACEGALYNFINATHASSSVIGLQAVACFASALNAWLPGIGAISMIVIAGTLILHVPMIPTLIIYANAVAQCLNRR